ncbi:MAG: 2'-5' RNA ligase family protein [bacterium]|nr:2'-5' RNA ligase family protein [bacterium]
MQLSLWLMSKLKSPERIRLRKKILEISGVRTTPAFQPHITLISEIDGDPTLIGEKTAELAKWISPQLVRFNEIGTIENNYYRILFLRAIKTQKLVMAHTVAQAAFGIQEPEYMPHCSMAYGDLCPDDVGELCADLVADEIPAVIFPVDGIQLWKTGGKVTEWIPLQWIPLTGA